MNISPEVTTLIAFASLLVSILSIIYAHRALKFEKDKFAFEQSQKDLIIELDQYTQMAELKNHYVLLSNFRINNGTSVTQFVKYFFIWLSFKDNSRYPAGSMRFGIDANGGTCGSEGSKAFRDLIYSQGGIDSVVTDINSKKRYFFDANNMTSIEPAPHSYAWKVLTVIPKSLLNELAAQSLKISKIELMVILHPQQQKVVSSSTFAYPTMPSQSKEFNLEELSSLFPHHSFQYEL